MLHPQYYLDNLQKNLCSHLVFKIHKLMMEIMITIKIRFILILIKNIIRSLQNNSIKRVIRHYNNNHHQELNQMKELTLKNRLEKKLSLLTRSLEKVNQCNNLNKLKQIIIVYLNTKNFTITIRVALNIS